MTTNISYDLLWETSEQLFKDDQSDAGSIINELIAKLSFYKTLDTSELAQEEKNKAKQFVMGNILMTLSHLTLKDNLNIYPIHKEAIAAQKINKMEKLSNYFNSVSKG